MFVRGRTNKYNNEVMPAYDQHWGQDGAASWGSPGRGDNDASTGSDFLEFGGAHAGSLYYPLCVFKNNFTYLFIYFWVCWTS